MFSISRMTCAKYGAGVAFLGTLVAPTATTVTLAGTSASALIWAGYKCTDWLVTWPHRRNWLNPLHAALCNPLGIPEDTRAVDYIKVPRDYQKREKVGRIDLPAKFTGVDVSTPTTIVKNKLGLSDVSVSYNLSGRKPHLVITQIPRPPAKVYFAQYQEELLKVPESAPLIGVGPRDKQVSVDLDTESPHILVSASTGGGKSVILRTMTAQMLHNGAQMVVLDFKRHSQKWAKHLPNSVSCKTIPAIHEALIALGAEGHHRNQIVDDWEGDESEVPVGPRLVIVLEEVNSTVKKLKSYWSEIRTSKDPKVSPAVEALGEILFMGRAVKMHVLAVAQSATVNALGGPEIRECFATRILARYTVNNWRMLVPEVHPVPRSSRHAGRVQVVLGGLATETQVLFMTPQEAAEWAMSGVVAGPPPVTSRDIPAPSPTWENVRDTDENVTPDLVLIKGGRMSLAQAAREGVVPMTADALRQAKRRRADFPEGVDGKYTAEELQEWYARRSDKQAG